MGFKYGDTTKDFDDLVEKVKAKKMRGESWFISSPLTPKQYSYLMRMIDKMPDSMGYVPPKKKSLTKINWQIEKEWSEVAQCSVIVKKYYETPDSSLVIYFENPDSLHNNHKVKP